MRDNSLLQTWSVSYACGFSNPSLQELFAWTRAECGAVCSQSWRMQGHVSLSQVQLRASFYPLLPTRPSSFVFCLSTRSSLRLYSTTLEWLSSTYKQVGQLQVPLSFATRILSFQLLFYITHQTQISLWVLVFGVQNIVIIIKFNFVQFNNGGCGESKGEAQAYSEKVSERENECQRCHSEAPAWVSTHSLGRGLALCCRSKVRWETYLRVPINDVVWFGWVEIVIPACTWLKSKQG